MALLSAGLIACKPDREEVKPTPPPSLKLTPVDYANLPGWDKPLAPQALAAINVSCKRFLAGNPEKSAGPLPGSGQYRDWRPACEALQQVSHLEAKPVIEARFQPYQVSADDEPNGLFTGYYEASLRGSRTRQPPYLTPLHSRPGDLVMVDLGEFRPTLQGQRIAGRVTDGRLRPFEARAEIVGGGWPDASTNELLYVDDPVAAFFVQIQGTGIVELAEGGTTRVGYAGQNGHPYFAIGKELLDRNVLTKEEISLQSIRQWLHENPDEADAVMNTNASYVFFREIEGDGPIGGEGVPLTAGHSLAIDRTLISYGTPIWVEIEPPLQGEAPINRLMVAQDTGGAIRGPVRGDVFFGYGSDAERLAGHMKSSGRYWVLLPHTANETDLNP